MLRLAALTCATAGPAGAAEEETCFSSAYWFQLREFLRIELFDGRARIDLVRGFGLTDAMGFAGFYSNSLETLRSTDRCTPGFVALELLASLEAFETGGAVPEALRARPAEELRPWLKSSFPLVGILAALQQRVGVDPGACAPLADVYQTMRPALLEGRGFLGEACGEVAAAAAGLLPDGRTVGEILESRVPLFWVLDRAYFEREFRSCPSIAHAQEPEVVAQRDHPLRPVPPNLLRGA